VFGKNIYGNIREVFHLPNHFKNKSL